jgi:hypothetical protein
LNKAVLLFLVSLLSAQSDAVRLRLPVHVQVDRALSKGQLTLLVNGSKRNIERLETRTRQLEKTSDLSRTFILSFHQDGYSPEVMEGVEYFVTQIADRTDTLTVLSPVKAYRLDLTRGSDRVLDNIEEILRRDSIEYKTSRAALLSNIDRAIGNVNRLMKAASPYVNYYLVLYNFFNQCKAAAVNFRKHFLAPFPQQVRIIRDLPERGDGETWWIHFQQRSFEPVPKTLRDAVRNMVLMQRAGQMWTSGGFDFSMAQKEFHISDDFPGPDILEAMIGENVCYNVINWGDSKPAQPELEELLSKITAGSGGRMITAVHPMEALKELRQHTDRFYEVVFPMSGKIEDKSIALSMDGKGDGTGLSYSQQIKKEKILDLVGKESRGKVEIAGFGLTGNRLDFDVSSYQRRGKEQVGLLKVRVQLYKELEKGGPVFNTHKTLRTDRDTVHISLPLPETYSGSLVLRLTVCDLMANQLVAVQRTVALN